MDVYYWITWLVAFACGWATHLFTNNRFSKPDALLNVDTRDPEKDFYDFVFLIPTGDIPKRKHLKVEVKTKT